MKKKIKPSIKFPKIKSVGKRLWGSEELVALIPKKNLFKSINYKKR